MGPHGNAGGEGFGGGLDLKRPRVLFLYPDEKTFISSDIQLLSKFSDLRPVRYRGIKDVGRVVKSLPLSQLTFSWFALRHAYLATKLSAIAGKASIVVAGGWDVCTVPELGYGYTLLPNRSREVSKTLARATVVLAVSTVTRDAIHELEPDANAKILPLGLDSQFFHPGGGVRRDRSVLTVASIRSGTIRLKGLDTFADVAKRCEDVHFVVVGRATDPEGEAFIRTLPRNVRVIPELQPPDLVSLYQKTAVYVQLSAHESFGAALAEALLCECNVIVTDRGAIPEVAGDAATYVPYGDPAATAEAVYEALDAPSNARGRRRIVSRFPLSAREAGLSEAVSECIGGGL